MGLTMVASSVSPDMLDFSSRRPSFWQSLNQWLGWKTVDGYLFREIMDFFVLAVVVFTLVLFFSDAFLDFIRDIQKLGIPLNVALVLVGLSLPETVALVLPASSFLAVMMVYNQLSTYFEIIAMRMSGIGLVRLMLPAMVLGIVASGISYTLGDYVVPFCNQQAVLLKDEMLRRGALPVGKSSFTFRDLDKNDNLKKLIYVSEYNGNHLGASTVIDLSDNKVMQIIQAKSGVWHPDRWEFQHANIYSVFKNKETLAFNHSEKFRVANLFKAKSSEVAETQEMKNALNDELNMDSDVLDFMTLYQRIQQRESLGRRVQKGTYINLWEKVTLPLSCLVMILVAVPLAIAPPRSGNNRGFIFSVAVLFLLYLFRAFFVAMGRSGQLTFGDALPTNVSLMLACWLPLVLIAALGFWLIQRKNVLL